jgi:hypothetical protein
MMELLAVGNISNSEGLKTECFVNTEGLSDLLGIDIASIVNAINVQCTTRKNFLNGS